jgi:DNA-binding MarR family transcriptional regulator
LARTVIKGVPQTHPDVQVFNEIASIHRRIREIVTSRLPPGMTFPQYELLKYLSGQAEASTPADIATALNLTPGAITNTLQRMEAAKLAQVSSDPIDGRKKRVVMTPHGQQLYRDCLAAIRPKIGNLREGFTAAEFRDALPFLRALRVWLTETD